MPEISRFFGIVIKMFFDDHNPPHFHAEYSGDIALIDIGKDKHHAFAGTATGKALLRAIQGRVLLY